MGSPQLRANNSNQPVGHTTKLQSLLAGLSVGDADARNEIIEHACERLRRLTQRMLREYTKVKRWEQTDDVLQNAMLRLHRSLVQVKPESPRQFYGLAATQIRRELIDLARHHYSDKGVGSNHETDRQDGKPRAEKAVSVEPENLEDWTRFHEVVDDLPDDQREVFSLLWYEGMNQPEACSVLDVSLKTVKRRWQAARLAIHSAMTDDQPR
jgi:RNA polymerase sigma-70 factor (ECF subfamily)